MEFPDRTIFAPISTNLVVVRNGRVLKTTINLFHAKLHLGF